MERRFVATLSSSQGRIAWAVIFRHPVRVDPNTGKPGLRVRQGLGTSGEAEANDRLSEANLPKHLDAQEGGKKPHTGPRAKPKPGEKFDDFQMTYALRLLRGQEIVSAADKPAAPAKPAPVKPN